MLKLKNINSKNIFYFVTILSILLFFLVFRVDAKTGETEQKVQDEKQEINGAVNTETIERKYIYNPIGKTDPFKSFIVLQEQNRKEKDEKPRTYLDVRLFKLLKILRVREDEFDIQINLASTPEKISLDANLGAVLIGESKIAFVHSKLIKNALEFLGGRTKARIEFWPVSYKEKSYAIMRSYITGQTLDHWLISLAIRTYSALGTSILDDMTRPVADLLNAMRKDIELYQQTVKEE